MKNRDIRELAKSNNVKLWEIAEKLNVSEFTFSRRLRHEMKETEKEHIINIIKELSAK